MNDNATNPFQLPDFTAMTASTQASFETMSKAYANWLKGANRLQTEAIRFVGDRFNKDLQILSRFGSCTKPEDFLSLQSEATTQLVNDYLEQGAKWIALLGDVAKEQTRAATAGIKGK